MPRKSIDRSLIVHTAAEIADADGLSQVTLAAVAERLGIKSPSLYNHVQGLPGLRTGLAYYGLLQLRESLARAAVGKSGEAAIDAIGFAYVNFVRQHPGVYEATISPPDFNNPDIQAASDSILELLLDVLGEYKYEQADAFHVVRGLRSLLHGFATLEMKQGFRMELERDESLKRMLHTYVRGLEAAGPGLK
ncbi:TetR/AcrR family transcriptional regulator [Paenibacillus thiaminolyticus]|uniref:TetR/AcrR family transcriptional regulator n=1 Tax=Paenibacillus thiaminolyticus TaxID=49283 RepID=A0A3A3GBV5_PANTH|nr:TetR-like C-terminal domain-containing protein [Paenibacillus thiaminolyticus]RJG18963.1 TetR/AcrR family transcriptional regulator [Paenibacillus thiaminolyticus]